MPATAYMPRGKMTLQSPAATSTGKSHEAKAQNTTDEPATSPRVASTMGAPDISTIRAPARTLIAKAPMATKYCGRRSSGRMG
jgi:hypothetical protein